MIGLAKPAYAQGLQDWGSCVVGGGPNDIGIPTLKCLEVVFSNLIFVGSSLVVVLLFIMLVVGAFQYLSSFGDPGKLKKAQSTLRFAILGFTLFLAAFLILRIIDTLFLGGQGTLFKLNIEQAP